MRILICVVLAVTMLSGCGQPRDFETMSDSYVQQELPQAHEVLLRLPEDATKAVFGDGDTGTLYLCDSYCIAVQTIPSGNLDATLREVTGYGRDRVQLWERKKGEISRFVCVWVSAGEGGDQTGKATILDDGNYHYVLSVMAPAEKAGELADTWQYLMDSFNIAP